MSANLSPQLEGELIASELVIAENISGDDEEDIALLRAMSVRASRYVASFSWCGEILSSYFGGGVGGVFGVFFFRIRPNGPAVDPWIWVAVGDVPPAYLPVSDCKSPAEFFRIYLQGMKRWVALARLGQEGTPEQGIPPVNLSPTPESAEDLDRRLQTLSFVVQPFFEDDSDTVN